MPRSVAMSVVAAIASDPEVALRAHRSARSAHVDRLRALVRSTPAHRLAVFDPETNGAPGAFAKLRRCAYAFGVDGLTPDDLLIVMAIAVNDAAARPPVFSHDTARVLWELPVIGSACELVEYVLPPGARGRTSNVRRRRTAQWRVDAVELGGLLVTPYERTIVDHARHAKLESAIAVCDSALHLGRTTRGALLAELALVPKGARGRRMAELAIHLADGRAESPLESLSRTRMFQFSLPMPDLQHEFYKGNELIGRTDFHWPQFGLVGESDGDLKYAVQEGDSPRAAVDVLLAEKEREKRLRRHPDVDDVARWKWDEALPPGRLADLLAEHGLRSVLDGGWPVPDGPLPKGAFLI